MRNVVELTHPGSLRRTRAHASALPALRDAGLALPWSVSRSAAFTAAFTAAFFVLAPGTTAGLVPWLITRWGDPDKGLAGASGLVLLVLGAAVVIVCFVRFVTEGRGTPAPVAPTETLVVGGLYRHVRNPMYVGVASAIAGQALLFRSPGVVAWLVAFLVAVVSFVRGYEEPKLARQFGASYERYRAAVPGWWPRVTPYRE